MITSKNKGRKNKNLINLNPTKFNEYVIEQQLEVAKEIKNSNKTVINFLI